MVTSPFCFFSIMDKLFTATFYVKLVFVIFIQEIDVFRSISNVCVAIIIYVVLLHELVLDKALVKVVDVTLAMTKMFLLLP